jgi:hypothetical protein
MPSSKRSRSTRVQKGGTWRVRRRDEWFISREELKWINLRRESAPLNWSLHLPLPTSGTTKRSACGKNSTKSNVKSSWRAFKKNVIEIRRVFREFLGLVVELDVTRLS